MVEFTKNLSLFLCSMKYCCVFLFFSVVQSKEVKNPDQPEKGEWRFSSQKEWETNSVGKDILDLFPAL